jgi:redox-sensitive bicupin YhaK (pirin superfamily)
VTLPDNGGRCGLLPVATTRDRPGAHLLTAQRLGHALNQGSHLTLNQPEGWSTALVVLEGNITVNGTAGG